MSEPMTRGHVIMHTAAFMQQNGPSGGHSTDGETSVTLRSGLDDMTAAGFYPRRFHTELLSTLASARHGDAGYARVLRCGASLLSLQNDFSVLLMKILTPDLFIKKLPRFWLRDHGSFGTCEIDALDPGMREARVRLSGVAGYDHIGIFWLGWLQGMLGELVATADVRQTGWSRQDSGPSEIIYEVKWS